MISLRLKLLFFASHRDVVGKESLSIEMPEGATVGQLLDKLGRDHPGLRSLEDNTMAAVNRELADRDHKLRDGDEVAFYPPVSGG